MQGGEVEAAVQTFARAAETNPEHLGALVGLGTALLALNRAVEAEGPARRALTIDPYDHIAVRTLSGSLQSQGRHAEALALADTVIAARPGHGEAWLARGDSLANLGRLDEALEAFETVPLRGDLAFEAMVRIGMTLDGLGRAGDGIEAFDRAIALRPDAATPRFQRGVLRLKGQDFAAGWDDYEARWRSDRFVASSRGLVPRAAVPELATSLSASDLRGKRVMLIAEQGVGDAIMFASMTPDLVRTAASVAFVCEPRLVRLFSASLRGVTVLDPRTAAIDTDAVDVIMAQGSLGAAFRRDVSAFPGTPYLQPRAEVRERWARRLGARPAGLRIGLSWRGGLPATRREARSVPLAELTALLDLPGCEYVSLQYGDVAAEVAAANSGRSNPIRLFAPAEIDDFEDLAGLVANLDAVVSVQTAVVHLAGGLGQSCLTLVPPNAVWRYGPHGATMPWYDSVRLFRQEDGQNWGPVILQIRQALDARLAGVRPATAT